MERRGPLGLLTEANVSLYGSVSVPMSSSHYVQHAKAHSLSRAIGRCRTWQGVNLWHHNLGTTNIASYVMSSWRALRRA